MVFPIDMFLFLNRLMQSYCRSTEKCTFVYFCTVWLTVSYSAKVHFCTVWLKVHFCTVWLTVSKCFSFAASRLYPEDLEWVEFPN